MSIELYIQGFRDGEPDGLEPEAILAFFGEYIRPHADGLYYLFYDELNQCEVDISVDDGLATSIVISRPCGDQRLYQSVFSILQNGPYALYSAEPPLVIAQRHMVQHLPIDMVDALGDPVLVVDGESIPTVLFGL